VAFQVNTMRAGGAYVVTTPTSNSSPSAKRSKKRPPSRPSRKISAARAPPKEKPSFRGHHLPISSVKTRNVRSTGRFMWIDFLTVIRRPPAPRMP